MTEQERTTPVETEEIVIDDTPVTVEKSVDETITVKVPAGLSDEAKAELEKTIKEKGVSKLVAAWNRKNQQMNEELAEIERIKAELKTPKPKEEKQTQDPGTQPEPLWKRLGLETEADLDEWAEDHPIEHARAVARDEAAKTLEAHTRKVEQDMEARLTKLKEEQTMNATLQSITAQGYDPLEIQAFARMNAITDMSKAFSLYCRLHQDKSDPVLRAQKEAQSKQINFIEQQHYRIKANPTQEEIANMSDEELKEWTKYAKEKAVREG